jgi:hypothetical protein
MNERVSEEALAGSRKNEKNISMVGVCGTGLFNK